MCRFQINLFGFQLDFENGLQRQISDLLKEWCYQVYFVIYFSKFKFSIVLNLLYIFQGNGTSKIDLLCARGIKKTNYIVLQSSLSIVSKSFCYIKERSNCVSLIRNKNVIISKRKLYFQSNNFTIENIKLHTFQSASVTKCVFVLHLL